MRKYFALTLLMTVSMPSFAQMQEANDPDPFTACTAVARQNNKTLSARFAVLSSTPNLKVYEARIDTYVFRIWHNMGRPFREGQFSFVHLMAEAQRPHEIARDRAQWESDIAQRAKSLTGRIKGAKEALAQLGPVGPLTDHFRQELADLNRQAATPVRPFVASEPAPEVETEPILFGAGIMNPSPEGGYRGYSSTTPVLDRFPTDEKSDLEVALRRGTIRSESQLLELANRRNQGILVLTDVNTNPDWAKRDPSRMYAISCLTGI